MYIAGIIAIVSIVVGFGNLIDHHLIGLTIQEVVGETGPFRSVPLEHAWKRQGLET